MVFTAEPVPVGSVFQVTVLKRVEGWLGSVVSIVHTDLRGEHQYPVQLDLLFLYGVLFVSKCLI